MVLQVHQSCRQLIRTLSVVNRQHKQVDEPRQRVLVHRVDVCQVSDGEEQNGGMDCDRLVTETSLVDLPFSFFGDRLRTPYNLHVSKTTHCININININIKFLVNEIINSLIH